MTLLVKYCGGCNVFYDRPRLVENIAARFPQLDIVYAGESADLAAILCGCPSACLPHSHITGHLGKWVLPGPEGGEALMAELENILRSA